MHPNVYLSSLWRAQTLDQVFVAMSFEPKFKQRYDEVFVPAIEGELLAGRQLKAYRVDNSRSGDSILTDIASGIAHSRLVLADVSVVDEGRYTETPIRNGNVMYEVGLALASRSPAEVLLIRDDQKRFLFDVSSIPHRTIDFRDSVQAIVQVRSALVDRLHETDLLADARIQSAVRRITQDEIRQLRLLAELPPGHAMHFALPELEGLSFADERGVDALLAKGAVRSVAVNSKDVVFYALTPFGKTLAAAVERALVQVPDPAPDAAKADPKPDRDAESPF